MTANRRGTGLSLSGKTIGNWNFHRTRSGTPVKSVPRFDFGDQMSSYRLRLTAGGHGRNAELAGRPSNWFASSVAWLLGGQFGYARPTRRLAATPAGPQFLRLLARGSPAAADLPGTRSRVICLPLYMRQFTDFVEARPNIFSRIAHLPIRHGEKFPGIFLGVIVTLVARGVPNVHGEAGRTTSPHEPVARSSTRLDGEHGELFKRIGWCAGRVACSHSGNVGRRDISPLSR